MISIMIISIGDHVVKEEYDEVGIQRSSVIRESRISS